MDSEEYDYLFKIVVVGDSSVGKSVLIVRYTTNQFSDTTKATIGVSFGHKAIKKGEELIQAQIWDTAGQERFRSITPGFYRGTQGALLVYSITDRKSFENVASWLAEIKRQTDCLIVLIGNKSDLESSREVPTSEAKAFAEKNGLFFLETSAKTAANVDQAFDHLITEIYSQAKAGKSLAGADGGEGSVDPGLGSGGTVKIGPDGSGGAPGGDQPPKPGCRC